MAFITGQATEAQIAYGTLLKLGNGASPEVFTTIAEVRNISGFGVTLDEIEVTHMESPGRTKEYISGLQDGDEFTITANMTNDNEAVIKSHVDAGVAANWWLDFPGSAFKYHFRATPKGFHIEGIEPNSALQISFALKLAGAITTSVG